MYPEQLPQFLRYQLYPFFHYTAQLSSGQDRIQRSVVHETLPGLLGMCYAIVAVGLKYYSWSLIIFAVGDFLPQIARQQTLTIVCIWCGMMMAFYFYVLRPNASQRHFCFLKVFYEMEQKCDKDDKDEDREAVGEKKAAKRLNLIPEEYVKFIRFRRYAFRQMNAVIFGISVAGILITAFEAYTNSVWHNCNVWVVLFWQTCQVVFIFQVCSVINSLPIFMSVLTYYLYLTHRQCRHAFHHLSRLQHNPITTLRQYYYLNPKYARVYRETVHITSNTRRCLTVLFTGYIQVIAYCTYLICFTTLPVFFKLLFCFIYLSKLQLLCVITIGGAAISGTNQSIGLSLLRFYNLANRRRIYHLRHLLQFETLAQNLREKQLNFTLINDFPINTRAFVVIFYYITVFFCLAFS